LAEVFENLAVGISGYLLQINGFALPGSPATK